MKKTRIILYLLTLTAMASFMLYAANAFDALNVSGRTHLRGAVEISGSNSYATNATWVGTFDLNDIMDVDAGDPVSHAVSVYQAMNGGALMVRSNGIGDMLHIQDDGTVVFAIEDGCAALQEVAWAPGLIAAGAQTTLDDFAVTGAALGDIVLVGAGCDVDDLVVSAQVTGVDKVSVVLSNRTVAGITPDPQTWYFTVIKTH